jgi:hypothetical protein
MKIDKRHGGAYDRGSADWWYQRQPVPHMFEGKTYDSVLVKEDEMDPLDVEAYWAGYNEAKAQGEHKYS